MPEEYDIDQEAEALNKKIRVHGPGGITLKGGNAKSLRQIKDIFYASQKERGSIEACKFILNTVVDNGLLARGDLKTIAPLMGEVAGNINNPTNFLGELTFLLDKKDKKRLKHFGRFSPAIIRSAKAGHDVSRMVGTIALVMSSKKITGKELNTLVDSAGKVAERSHDPERMIWAAYNVLASRSDRKDLSHTIKHLKRSYDYADGGEYEPEHVLNLVSNCIRERIISNKELPEAIPHIHQSFLVAKKIGCDTNDLYKVLEQVLEGGGVTHSNLPPMIDHIKNSLVNAKEAGHRPQEVLGSLSKLNLQNVKMADLLYLLGSTKSPPKEAKRYGLGNVLEHSFNAHMKHGIPAKSVLDYQRKTLQRGHFPSENTLLRLHSMHERRGRRH